MAYSKTTFHTPFGWGHVVLVDGEPWVEWMDDDEWQDGLYRVRSCRNDRSEGGIRYLFYVPRPGRHNKAVNVPEHCIRSAKEVNDGTEEEVSQ